jgi:uncharacterized protein with HEPN domain
LRRDELYLADIVEAADAISRFIDNVTQDVFLADELCQSAVLQKLTVIGEAAARLSPEIKSRANSIPWSQIVGFRNIAIHAYFNVDWSIVWIAATNDAPLLRAQVQSMQSTPAPD